MSVDEELTIENKSRGYMRSRVSKLCSNILTDIADFSPQQKLKYIDRLTSLKAELDDKNKVIFTLLMKNKTKDSELDQKIEEEEEYDNKILDCISNLKTAGETYQPNRSHTVGNTKGRKLKLPDVPLPTFTNGKNENFKKFIEDFETTINEYDLTSNEKFLFLKKQVSGGAYTLLNNLDVSRQSYETGKDLLQKAFGKAITVKFDLIRRISELKLGFNDDPYSFIGDVQGVVAEVETLKLNTNEILQYFIWEGMNSKFQDHLVAITNKHRPNVEEILDNLFEATDRYERQQSKYKNSSSKQKNTDTVSMAVDVKSSKPKGVDTVSMAVDVKSTKYCCLCKSEGKDKNHDVRFCPVFDTPQSKVNKLKSMNACIKCGYSNHQSKLCKNPFKSKCQGCSRDHMTYLCLSNSKPNATRDRHGTTVNTVESKSESNSDAEETYSTQAIVEISHSTGADNIALPTFTADLIGENTETSVRIFKDTGAQRNFITKDLAQKMKFPVLCANKNFNIKGFNVKKNVTTDVVQVALKIGNKTETIPAICVDSISTTFKIDHMKDIIDKFKSKGYAMADKNLNPHKNVVSEIGLILGSESSHVLPTRDVLFGTNNPTIFMHTPIGIMLAGDVKKLYENLESIPKNTENQVLDVADSNIEVNVATMIETVENVQSQTKIFDSDYLTVLFNEENSENSSNSEFNENLENVSHLDSEVMSEQDQKTVQYIQKSIERDTNGRISVNIPWNHKNFHLLGKNFKLSIQILKSGLTKLRKNPELLKLYDDVFEEQLKLGIIEKITDLPTFMDEHPECSFLGHTGVCKFDRDTTKLRVVMLSNLCEKDPTRPLTVSHNQCILSGPCLNNKICTAVTLLRFDKFLLIFDLSKAFLSVGIKEVDQNRLLFLWVSNLKNGCDLIAYRPLRLPFGLPASPLILMLVLHHILIGCQDNDQKLNEFKNMIYTNMYVDNGGYSANSVEELRDSLQNVKNIFEEFGFKLQQFSCNDENFQKEIDGEIKPSPTNVKLFGIVWDRVNDQIFPQKIDLNVNANTKKEILSTLNAIYDIFNVYAPVLLRARVFMQKLQKDTKIPWDEPLTDSLLQEWRCIARQANLTPIFPLNRSVGERSGEFELAAYTDASRIACGSVIYIIDLSTNQKSFLTANSKLHSSNLQKKSIPSLELYGITQGLKSLIETKESLTNRGGIHNSASYAAKLRGANQNADRADGRGEFSVEKI